MAVIVAAPELRGRVYDALALPADSQARFGKDSLGIDPGMFVSVAQRFAVGIPFLFMLIRGPERNRLYIALFVTPLVLDVTTGIVPQPEHYITQVWHVFALPAFIAGGAALAPALLRGRGRPAAIAFGVLAVTGVAYLAVFQVRVTARVSDQFAMDANDHAAFDWINANVSDRETVVSPSLNSNTLIPSLTPASPYFINGSFVRLQDDELIDRFLRAQAAFGMSESDVFARLDPANYYPTSGPLPPEGELERRFEYAAAYYLFNWEIIHPDTIEARLPEWRQRYRELLSEVNVLASYQADYLFCGRRERFWRPDRVARGTFVRETFRQGDAAVYRIVPPGAEGTQEFQGCG